MKAIVGLQTMVACLLRRAVLRSSTGGCSLHCATVAASWVLGCFVVLCLGGCRPVNQLDHLEADLAEMRLCQRRADNKAFFDYWLQASHHIKRIEEEEDVLAPDDLRRFHYAKNEFLLISITYHHTMGHYDQCRAELAAMNAVELERSDTVHWLHYDYLTALSVHASDEEMADRAYRLAHYGDSVYWTTEARIFSASALNKAGRYDAALDTLGLAYADLQGDDVPECLCRLSEQTSVAYAGRGMKDSSDYYRNGYLDLLEVIRENKEWEFRSQQLERRTLLLHRLFIAFVIFLGIFAVGFAALALVSRNRHRKYTHALDEQYDDRVERFRDELAMHEQQLEKHKRDNVVRKASLSIVTNIIPYIDRARREITRLERHADLTEEDRQRSIAYIDELTERINELNDILTLWIQTKQGMVDLHLETFAVQEVLDIVARRQRSFADQQLLLTVKPSDAAVKADRALTLFMLNTLADNARKFTPAGGTVMVEAIATDDYVELSVADTGIGLSKEDVESILGSKVYDASRIGDPDSDKGSGFGLMNCKGIIEKYRKTDSFFAVCRFGIDSEPGKGARFWFRLPRVVRRAVMMVILTVGAAGATGATGAAVAAEADTLTYDPLLARASTFADSVYFANVDGFYEEAVVYADSALAYLNRHCMEQTGGALDSLALRGAKGGVVEKQWWMSDFATDYFTILDIRNELAVAFLALHRLDDYTFNNRSYTELFKLTGEDVTLMDYCAQMTEAGNDMLTMLVLSVVVLVIFVSLWYQMVIRPRKAFHRQLEQRNRELNVQMDEDYEMRRVMHEENRLHVQNMVLDNCLSTIKHETSYYPGAIHQIAGRLLEQQPRGAELAKAATDMAELAAFYREMFGTLASCASRQLEEVTFRRNTISTVRLLAYATDYLQRKASAVGKPELTLNTDTDGCEVEGDETLLELMLENLIDEALTGSTDIPLSLNIRREGDFVAFRFVNPNRTLTQEELRGLFFPSFNRMQATDGGQLEGAEYVVCRQIIREHDEYFGHMGCRILAERASDEGGIAISFTVPAKK